MPFETIFDIGLSNISLGGFSALLLKFSCKTKNYTPLERAHKTERSDNVPASLECISQ